MSRPRPLLESLEGRYTPAVLQGVPATPADAAVLAGSTADLIAAAVALPAEPAAVFAASEPGVSGSEVFIAPPPEFLSDSVLERNEDSLEFPASGGGGGRLKLPDELVAALLPASEEGENADVNADAEEAPQAG
jgi:hypothetical protein